MFGSSWMNLMIQCIDLVVFRGPGSSFSRKFGGGNGK